MSQLSFCFESTKTHASFREEDFSLLPENRVVMNFLREFFSQKSFSQSRFHSVIIEGGRGSGKTHLMQIFSQKYHGEFLDKEEIAQLNLSSWFESNQFYILENFTEIMDEELVLRLINSASEAGAFLVLTSTSKPQFQLKDLTSRLKNIPTVQIQDPCLESIKQLLANGLARRQITVSNQVIDLIAGRIERSYLGIANAIKRVETYCQEIGSKPKIEEIKNLFAF